MLICLHFLNFYKNYLIWWFHLYVIASCKIITFFKTIMCIPKSICREIWVDRQASKQKSKQTLQNFLFAPIISFDLKGSQKSCFEYILKGCIMFAKLFFAFPSLNLSLFILFHNFSMRKNIVRFLLKIQF